jgi:hypothetical protein
MPYEPIVPKGQHLGTSHNIDDAVTGHLFEDGTNELKGHAAWRWVDEADDDYSPSDDGYSSRDEHEPLRQLTQEEIEAIAKLAEWILTGIVWAVTTAGPPLIIWWNLKAVPGMKSAWKRLPRRRKSTAQPAATRAEPVRVATFVASASTVEVAASTSAVLKSKVSMSSAEWEQRFHAMLAAGAFKDQQLQILFNSRIDDDGVALEANDASSVLTARQFVERITSMLEANPALLDEETSAELMRVFSVRGNASRSSGSLELNRANSVEQLPQHTIDGEDDSSTSLPVR